MDADSAERTLERTLALLGKATEPAEVPPAATITERTLQLLQGQEAARTAPQTKSIDLPLVRVHDGRVSDPLASDAVGPDLDLLQTIGQGGMGEVILARQRCLDRRVAIKRPLPGARAATQSAIKREAMVTGHLEHPNIIPIHVLGRSQDDDRPLIVMKRIEGRSWQHALRADAARPGWPAVDPERLAAHLQTLMQVCNAVAFAHSRGIIHRDIKPENVMVGDFGEVYLLDWGLAVRVDGEERGRGRLLGTPLYMAPEMAAAEPLERRTDVYLLGATLHEILTGEPRHQGDTLRQVLMAALRSEPVAYGDDVPVELAELANRATAPRIAARPESASAFRQALADYERHRAAVEICRATDERLVRLERALADPEESAVTRARLLHECRFGYGQSLAQWAENPAARRGLRLCLAAAVRHELAAENLPGARAALAELAELGEPTDSTDSTDSTAQGPSGVGLAALETEVEALSRRQTDAEREREALRRLARQVDPASMSWRLLVPLLGLLALVVSGIAVYVLLRGAGPSARSNVIFAGIVLTVTLLTVFLDRRRLRATAFNRRMASWFALTVAAFFVHRLVGLLLGVDPLHTLVLDALLCGALLGAGAITLFSGLWLSALCFWAVVPLGVVWPSSMSVTLLVAPAGALISFVLLWRRARSRGALVAADRADEE